VLLGAVDVFVMPSFHEGLPLAALEAQAAGVPCVLASGIATETDVVPQLVQRIALSQGVSRWAEAVLAAGRESPPVTRGEALALLEASPFDIRRSQEELERVYLK
jgi:glycosyltransferase involved in cell wall biosynthesis